MTDLGPGIRFTVGWRPEAAEIFARLGTVREGPFLVSWILFQKGNLYESLIALHLGLDKQVPPYWRVRLDGDDGDMYLREDMIIPLDDDNDEHDTSEKDRDRTPEHIGCDVPETHGTDR